VSATVVTTTWNCADLVGAFLAHYRQLGFERVLVMDFDSTDGTRDILCSREWRSLVTLVPFPGLSGLDSSNLLLSLARRAPAHGRWCLFCDPDEFLVTPSMRVDDPLLARVMAGTTALTLRRFNVTAERSIARDAPARLSPHDALHLRIDRRHDRVVESDMVKDVLDPPWIFTAIPGKVFVDVDAAVAIGDGDHTVETKGRTAVAPDGVYLLHYPMRSYSRFAEKIEQAESDFRANSHLPPTYGWQLKRWIVVARRGGLYDEYLSQFVPDVDVEQLLADGTLTRDRSVVAGGQLSGSTDLRARNTSR
jgi:hypothetical protein